MESDFIKNGLRNLKNQLKAAIGKPEYILIFSLACGIRIITLILSVDQIGLEGILSAAPDSVLYMNMAKDLLNGTNLYEHGFMTFGYGFAIYLSLISLIFGHHPLIHIILNILMSSFSCIMIYILAKNLLHSRAVAILSGLLFALSYTSIMLSQMVLSDTLFIFTFLSGILLFHKGQTENKKYHSILAGCLWGTSALIRSIGQFWPLVIILIILLQLYMNKKRTNGHFKLTIGQLKYPAIAVVISITFISAMIIKNWVTYDIPSLAMTGSGGAANMAAYTIERLENRPDKDIRREWTEKYKMENNIDKLSMADYFRINAIYARRTFQKYPSEMIKTYLMQTFINWTDINYSHRILLPQFNYFTIPVEFKIRKSYINLLGTILGLSGLIVLILKRNYEALIFLAGIYFYFFFTCGFYRWQGSRLFFPGQIAEIILISTSLVVIFHKLFSVVKSISTKKSA